MKPEFGSLFPISQKAVEATYSYIQAHRKWATHEKNFLLRHNPYLGAALLRGAEMSGLHAKVDCYQLAALMTYHTLREQSRLSGIALPQLTPEQTIFHPQQLYQRVRTGGTLHSYVYDCAEKMLEDEPYFREMIPPTIRTGIRLNTVGRRLGAGNVDLIPKDDFENIWGITDMYYSIRYAIEPPETSGEPNILSQNIGPEVISTTPVFPLSEKIILHVSKEFAAIRINPKQLPRLITEETQHITSNTGVWLVQETRMQAGSVNNHLIYTLGGLYTHRLVRLQAQALGMSIPEVPRSIAIEYFEKAQKYVKSSEDTLEDVFLRMSFDLFPKETALDRTMPALVAVLASSLQGMNVRDFRLGIMDTYSVLKMGFEREQQKLNRN